MTAQLFESPLDRATFRSSRMFGGIDLMSARFLRHSFAPHAHDELMIGVIYAGVKSFRCGKALEYAAAGSLSVVNPGEMHTGEREQGGELIYAALYVPQAALSTMLACQRGERPAIGQAIISDGDIWRNFAVAHQLVMEGDDAAAAEEAMVLGVSILFDRYGTRPLVHAEAEYPKAVRRAMEFFQAYAFDSISLEDASNASGVSLFHLIRLFQRHVGLTPHTYLTQIRIAKSQQLLKLGIPASQVALDVGFADQAHFTKRFKRLTGATPAHYARSFQ